MIWRFERGDEVLRLETRLDAGGFVLVIIWANRPALTERYSDPAAYEARIRALEADLANEQWCQAGGPTLVENGWRGPIQH